jgi:DNA-binding transcriptional MerR regulator
MVPKRASSKVAPSVDEAAKAALLAEKKGKALVDTTHQEACKDDALSKRQRNGQPTLEGSLRTCSSGGQPQPPPGFAPLEGADATEDGEVIGISAEEQLQLRALRIKNRNLQKQKEILEAKRQHVSAQAKVRQMIRDEEQKAQELEQEIALMQRKANSVCNTAHSSNSMHKSKTCSSLSSNTPSCTPQHSKVSTTLTSGVPWRHTCKCHHGPPTSGQGPIPSTTVAQTQHSTS